jgi:hypothetical protein
VTTNHLTPRAELQMRLDGQRVIQNLDRHLRQQRAAVEVEELLPVGEVSDSDWAAFQAEPLPRHNEDEVL